MLTSDNSTNEEFIIYLTIDGTSYEKVAVKIKDPDKTIRDQISSIVDAFNLPKFDIGGNPIQYLLGQIMNDGEEPEILDFEDEDGREQTLIDYNIQSGNILHLTTIPIAGGSQELDDLSSCLDDGGYVIVDMDDMEGVDSDFASTSCPDTKASIEDGISFGCTANQTERPYSQPESYTCHPMPCESPSQHSCQPTETYGINEPQQPEKSPRQSIWRKLFGKKHKSGIVNASAYAPAEITLYKSFIIRVFIHRPEESGLIDHYVKEVDKTAVKKANKPLDIPVKKNDRITVQLKMPKCIALDSHQKTVIWHNHFTDCSFIAKLTDDTIYDVHGTAYIYVNGILAGELVFTIDVVDYYQTKNIYAKVESRRYSRIFISYSHLDEMQVRGFAECCRVLGKDYFFDRHSLDPGDKFKEKILEYIDKADLFVLCWSKNAAESKWVKIEREHALLLIKEGNATLKIHPLILKPEAPLPLDMSDTYHFGVL